MKASLPVSGDEGPEQQASSGAGGVEEQIGGIGVSVGQEGLVPLLGNANEEGSRSHEQEQGGSGKARKGGTGETEEDEDEDGVLDRVDGVGDGPAGGVRGAGRARERDHDPEPEERQQKPEAHVASVANSTVREWRMTGALAPSVCEL